MTQCNLWAYRNCILVLSPSSVRILVDIADLAAQREMRRLTVDFDGNEIETEYLVDCEFMSCFYRCYMILCQSKT